MSNTTTQEQVQELTSAVNEQTEAIKEQGQVIEREIEQQRALVSELREKAAAGTYGPDLLPLIDNVRAGTEKLHASTQSIQGIVPDEPPLAETPSAPPVSDEAPFVNPTPAEAVPNTTASADVPPVEAGAEVPPDDASTSENSQD